jgi:uncharacterized protein (DUF488 family)
MGQPPIYTIGHGTREMAGFVAVLQRLQIAYLIDVRSRPYSRFQPDFSKGPLEQHLKTAGIRYVYMGDLLGGQPPDPACYSEGKVDYDKVRQKEFFRRGIGRLREAWKGQRHVALLCSELRPEQCHRSKLIGAALAEEGISVAHIDESDSLLSQEVVLMRLVKGQPSLFGDDFYHFTSRKRYEQEGDEEED